MPTFQDIFTALPQREEKKLAWITWIHRGLLLCAVVFAALLFAGWRLQKLELIYAAWIPLVAAVLGLAAQITVEARDLRKMFRNDPEWLGGRLDQKFEGEKQVAASLLGEDILELKHMAARIDAEITTQEKWLEVIKPFSLLIPATLVVVTSRYFKLPDDLQEMAKLSGGALIIGLATASVSVYSALVKMRRISSTLSHAIRAIDDKKPAQFRKVSRKRMVRVG